MGNDNASTLTYRELLIRIFGQEAFDDAMSRDYDQPTYLSRQSRIPVCSCQDVRCFVSVLARMDNPFPDAFLVTARLLQCYEDDVMLKPEGRDLLGIVQHAIGLNDQRLPMSLGVRQLAMSAGRYTDRDTYDLLPHAVAR